MVRVFTAGPYTVYIYQETGGHHHDPHCHVYWADGRAAVNILTLQVLAGDALPRQLRDLLRGNRGRLQAAWNQLNSDRTI